MKATILTLVGLAALVACQSTDPEPAQSVRFVNVGMDSAEVVQAAGAPDAIVPTLYGIVWWNYSDTSRIVMQHDTVSNVVHDLQKTQAEIDSLLGWGIEQ